MKLSAVAGHVYQAKLKLGFFERLASNATIAKKFEEVGLTNVKVWGDGSERYAQGTCNVTAEVDLPSQIVEVKDLG